jgi:hypothetical protein
MTALRALLLCACAGLLAACGREPQPVAQEEAPVEAPPAPVVVPTVTEAQVRQVAAAANAAVSKFDIYALRAQLGEDVRLVAVPAPNSGPTLKVEGRDRVVAQIRSSWGLIEKPSYTARAGSVVMAADGTSGTVEYAAETKYTYDRHTYVDAGSDTYVVMIRSGEPKVVAMYQTATGLTIDGNKRF